MEQEEKAEVNASAQAQGAKAEATPSGAKAEATPSVPRNEPRIEPSDQGGSTSSVETSNPEFTSQSVFEAVPGIKSIEVDDDTILVDILRDKYVRLNATGTFIWRLILQRLSLGEISEQVSQRFNLALDKAFEEASVFTRELIKSGMAVQRGEQKFSQKG